MIDLSDPISRQQAITALRALSDDDGYINAPHEVVTDVVRGLPPVQAEHEQTTQPERGESDKLASKIGGTWVDVTCPNCGCEIHVESAQPEPSEITDEQAILHLQSTGWMQNHDREMYESGLKKRLADDSGDYDSLIPCEDTISRQDAIEATANTLWHYPNECYRNLSEYEFAKGLAELGLKSVPPAQPEPCNGCGYLGESCVGEGCGKLIERKDGEAE